MPYKEQAARCAAIHSNETNCIAGACQILQDGRMDSEGESVLELPVTKKPRKWKGRVEFISTKQWVPGELACGDGPRRY